MQHHFDIKLASELGVFEAIFIENLRFWIAKNKANNKHFYDGRYWTYNSAKAFSQLFPYWSRSQVERIILKLKLANVLLIGNYNQSSYDRTNWYSFTDEFDSSISGNGLSENAKSLIDTDINTDTCSHSESPSESQNTALQEEFEIFYKAYPKKIGKPAALKAFKAAKIKDLQPILDDIEVCKQSDSWQKNNGQFIPYPATYLNQRRWEKEEEPLQPVNRWSGAI